MSIDREHFRKHAPIDLNRLFARARKQLQAEREPESVDSPEPINSVSPEALRESKLSGIPAEADCGLLPPNFVLDESQAAAVEKLTVESRGCLMGAAGTGKTTMTRYLVYKWIYEYGLITNPLDIAFVSFTGTASQVIAKSLPPWLRSRCQTIHSLLEYAPAEELTDDENGDIEAKWRFRPRRTAFNKLNEKILLIDEASMVAMPLWQEVEDALRPDARVIAVGDLNQLPPFGGDSAFRKMLAEWPTHELTVVHRQADPKAQGIVDAAHAILRGETPLLTQADYDTFMQDEWAVWGFELPTKPVEAANNIVRLLARLKDMKTPEGTAFYDPHRDRVLTPGNGYDENSDICLLQQHPLNETVAPHFDPPSQEHPLTIINAGRSTKKFAVGFRVMATKNERPDTKDRVTNGMLGRIVEIKRNLAWAGDWGLVGPIDEVAAEKNRRFAAAVGEKPSGDHPLDSLNLTALKDMKSRIQADVVQSFRDVQEQLIAQKEGGRLAGPASHEITIAFENGSTRVFRSQSQVDSLQLAYVTTVAKAQGAQHETVIVIIHSAVKFQLNRELLYTAITRATRRVIILYTDYGMTYSLSKQRIKGSTLQEKIQRYLEWVARYGGES